MAERSWGMENTGEVLQGNDDGGIDTLKPVDMPDAELMEKRFIQNGERSYEVVAIKDIGGKKMVILQGQDGKQLPAIAKDVLLYKVDSEENSEWRFEE